MSRPVLLDLFCGAGGAAAGYHDAGFEIIGVDIEDQPNYPYEFVKADALEAIKLIGWGADAIHASPPCQAYTTLAKGNNANRGRVAGWRHGTYYDGPYKAVYGDGGGKGSLDEWRKAMGIPWMHTRHELAEAIPPAYSEYIGAQLLQALEVAA